MNGSTNLFSRLEKNLAENRANGVGKTDMANDPITEKSVLTVNGSVDELVRNNHIARVEVFLHGSHRTDADDPLDAQQFHGIDICPEVKGGGGDAVALSMTG